MSEYDYDSGEPCCEFQGCGRKAEPGSAWCHACLHGMPPEPYRPPTRIPYDVDSSPSVVHARRVADRFRAKLLRRADMLERARQS